MNSQIRRMFCPFVFSMDDDDWGKGDEDEVGDEEKKVGVDDDKDEDSGDEEDW